MPIDASEKITRQFVEGITRDIEPGTASDTDQIRTQALAMFVKELDAKLKNLQDGETLQITFRVDIIGKTGKIRGGSGANRNMPEYIAWRDAVFQRDNYICQGCHKKGHLNAHHIKHWATNPELRFDIDNGTTLCDDCHAKQHPHLNLHKNGTTKQVN